MKIIQTADWHVHPRYKNCASALNQIVDLVDRIKPEIVIHSGDVFDTRGRIDPTSIKLVRNAIEQIAMTSKIFLIPGNHDAANAWGEVDSVRGVLGDGRNVDIITASRPGVYRVAGAQIAAVPWPSKYHLAAEGDDATDVVSLLGDVFRGLAAEAAKTGGATILTFHGAVAGGVFDNEKMIGVGQDITIPRDFLNGPWGLILAGHLHRRQTVGPVHYPGSPTQFSFAQAGYTPGAILAEWDGDTWEVENIDLDVEFPFVSIAVDLEGGDSEKNLATAVHDAVLPFVGHFDQAGTQARIKVRAPSEAFAGWPTIEAHARQTWPSVNWKFVLEKIPPVRIRSEVTVEATTLDLLDEWGRLNENLGPILGRLKAWGTDLEESIDLTTVEPTTGATYKPALTVLENFKQYKGARIEWTKLPRITCIKGPNAAGKSNAARAEAFALFGAKALEGSPLRRVVKDGEKSGLVRHTFRTDEHHYKIERTVKLTGKGTLAGGDVSFSRMEALDEWRSLNGANARETQSKIEDLVGTPEMFFSTRFARQSEINKLLKITPGERKLLLQSALQTGRFAALEEAARKRLNTYSREAEKARGGLEVALRAVEGLPDKRESLEAVNAKTSDLDKDIRRVNLNLAADKELLTVAAQTESVALMAVEKKGEYDRLVNALARRGGVLAESQVELERLVIEADSVAEKIDALDELREEERRLGLLFEEWGKYERDLERTGENIAGAERARRRQIETMESDLAALQKKTAILASVPCQDPENFSQNPTDQVHNDPENFKSCQFLLDAVEATDEIPRTEKSIKFLKADKTHLDEHIERQKVLLDEHASLGYESGDLIKIRKKIDAFEEGALNQKVQQIAGAKGRLQEIERESLSVEKEMVAFTDKRDSITVTEDVANEAAEEAIRLRTLIGGHEKALQVHAEDQRRLVHLVGTLEAQVSAMEAIHEEAKELEKALAALELDAAVATAYIGAVGVNGIPFLILERALPQIQDTMNVLLEGSPLSVTIDPIRDLESGAARDEVNIRFTDANGDQVLEDASGYQENVLGVALRAAVAELQAERAGIRPEFFVIDEGFGAYDPENIPHGREMIHRLADLFGKVVYITHVPEVQEAAEAEIVVTPSVEGSTLEVIQS